MGVGKGPRQQAGVRASTAQEGECCGGHQGGSVGAGCGLQGAGLIGRGCIGSTRKRHREGLSTGECFVPAGLVRDVEVWERWRGDLSANAEYFRQINDLTVETAQALQRHRLICCADGHAFGGDLQDFPCRTGSPIRQAKTTNREKLSLQAEFRAGQRVRIIAKIQTPHQSAERGGGLGEIEQAHLRGPVCLGKIAALAEVLGRALQIACFELRHDGGKALHTGGVAFGIEAEGGFIG